jgi:hypothetical protein
MSILSQRYFWDEQAAHAKLEEIVWPNGPMCIRCGAADRIGAVIGKGARAGLKFCCRCRKQFRATIGTIFEGSHVPLHKWFQACFILSTAQTPVTAYQLHLHLEVTNKTAVGMVRQLWGRILSARQKSCRAGTDRSAPLRPQAGTDSPRSLSGIPGRSARALTGQSCGGIAPALRGVGSDELPQTGPSPRPQRQFLRFIEATQQLGCLDKGEFERLLAELDIPVLRGTRMPLSPGSTEAKAPSKADPDISAAA